ncbi:uncharacterized protein METZ01_LOCUS221796, partial [marine metagenome]
VFIESGPVRQGVRWTRLRLITIQGTTILTCQFSFQLGYPSVIKQNPTIVWHNVESWGIEG